jgi:hypothetical protein
VVAATGPEELGERNIQHGTVEEFQGLMNHFQMQACVHPVGKYNCIVGKKIHFSFEFKPAIRWSGLDSTQQSTITQSHISVDPAVPSGGTGQVETEVLLEKSHQLRAQHFPHPVAHYDFYKPGGVIKQIN